MLKKLFTASAVGLAALVLFSCKEQPVGIDTSMALFTDTVYIAAVEAAQTKNFYVEEFSGVKCTNCPAGAAKLEELNASNNDRLKVITVHAGSFTTPDYQKGSKQDFRSEQGLQLMSLVYGGEVSKPAASFDRMSVASGANPLVGAINQWDAMLSTVKTQNANNPVNVYVSSVSQGASSFKITVKFAYTQTVTEPQFFSLYLAEDSIVDNQIDPLMIDYTFRHVFRQSITPITGARILDTQATIVAGTVFERTYNYTVDLTEGSEFKGKNWNLDNIHVVALVHNATSNADKRVYQVNDTHLK